MISAVSSGSVSPMAVVSKGFDEISAALSESDGSTEQLASAAVALSQLQLQSQVALLVMKKAQDMTDQLLVLPKQ